MNAQARVPTLNASKIEDIKNLGMELALNEKTRMVCPWCCGGLGDDKGKKTLGVHRKPGVISYICYRASCNMHGSLNVSNLILGSEATTETKPTIPVGDLIRSKMQFQSLNDIQKDFLKQRYFLEPSDVIGWYFVKNMGRMWIPMYDMWHQVIGGNARSFSTGAKIKSIVVQNNLNHPKASWYRHRATEEIGMRLMGDKTIWLVEDQISAIRASKYVDTVALMGSHVSELLITSIKAVQYEHVVIALDKDAYALSLNYRNKYAELFKSFRVAQLPKDIKDMTPTELESFLINTEVKGKDLV